MPDALTDPNAVARALGQGVIATPTDVPWGPLSQQLGTALLPQSMQGPSQENINQFNRVMTDVEHGKYKPGKLPTPDIGQSPSAAADAFTKGALEGVGMFAGPPSASAAAKTIPAIFAGIGAKTADRGALKIAQRMAEAGESPHSIHALTGWFQHPIDKRWRFEISDLGLSTQPGTGIGITHPDNPVVHPELAKAYPQLDKMLTSKIEESPKDIGGFYHFDNPERMKIEVGGPTDAIRNSVAGHELQHAVQAIEGFAPGSHIDTHWGLLNDPGLFRETQNLSYDMAERAAVESYLRGSGETEARNVEDRLNMNRVQRRMNPPWLTQDRPYSVQSSKPDISSMESIIHFLNNPPRMRDIVNTADAPSRRSSPEGLIAEGGSSWRLNDAQKHNIADRYRAGEPVASIAQEYGIHPNMVYRHAMTRGAEPRMVRDVRNQYTGPAPEPPPDTRLPWNSPKLKEDYSRETMYNTLLTLQKLLGK